MPRKIWKNAKHEIPDPVELVPLPERITGATLPPPPKDVDYDFYRNLVLPYQGRKRAFLIALCYGRTRGQARIAAAIFEKELADFFAQDKDFYDAAKSAESLGFHGVFETELYERALAGAEDRNSMRALELVLKQRDASYRDQKPGINVNLGLGDALMRFTPEALGVQRPQPLQLPSPVVEPEVESDSG